MQSQNNFKDTMLVSAFVPKGFKNKIGILFNVSMK